MSDSSAALIPVSAFVVASLVIALIAEKRTRSGSGFLAQYFIGNRSLGGFVLAMTTIATYGSVSSFVGGPGQAWQVGFGWVYMASVQVTALFLLFGIMGKKMALISRRLGAVTVIDVIRARYHSDVLANICALIIIAFFAAMMVAQFVGGAKIFEAVTGYSYLTGLTLFGVAVVVYTTIGGFRAVALTDALCGIAMIVGIVVLAAGILAAGGGYETIMQNIATAHPALLEPFSAGQMPLGLYFTQWLLVGICTFCLPQSVVRCMGFKDDASLVRALVVGTIIIGCMMIGVTALGVLAKGVLTGSLADYGGSVDNIIPQAITATLPGWLAGVAIVGPIAASISTVSSLLINSSSAVVKDMWMHHREQSAAPKPSERLLVQISHAITLCIGAVVFVLSIVPPDVIWKINMFAFGGLETAFCPVFVMGLFWRRATSRGAILSMAGGVVVYCFCMAQSITFFGLHQIVIGIVLSFALMIVGSLCTRREICRDEIFFPTAP